MSREAIIRQIPLVKSVYGALKELADFFSRTGNQKNELQKTVMVPLGDTGMELMGFITRESFDNADISSTYENAVAVYLPMAYQVGGYCIILPRSLVRPIDMPVREGIQFAATAGMIQRKKT